MCDTQITPHLLQQIIRSIFVLLNMTIFVKTALDTTLISPQGS